MQVEALPIGNSDYTRLALVLPGVTQNSNFAFAQYTINGSRSRSNGFNIDGVSDTDPSTYLPSINEGGNSATAATRLPLDAIQEVTVSANAGADSGQNSGSVMNVTVRSGTNQFHGSLYELHRDAALDAANYFENLGGVSKAPFVWNNFGGTVGGPISIPTSTTATIVLSSLPATTEAGCGSALLFTETRLRKHRFRTLPLWFNLRESPQTNSG